MKKLLYIMAMFLFTIGAKAEGELTLNECRKIALSHNKSLKKASLANKEAIANKRAARTAYLPAVDASVNALQGFNSNNITVPGLNLPVAANETALQNGEFTDQLATFPGMTEEMDPLSVVYGGVAVSQPIYVGGKILFSNKQADLGVEISGMAYQLKKEEVLEFSDKMFWSVAQVEANVELAKSYIKLLSELEEQMDNMYQVGLTPASEKLKVSVQKNEAKLQLLKAENALKVSKMYFNQVLGRDLGAPVQIKYDTTQVAMPNLSDGLSLALLQRNEIKIQERMVKMSEYQKKVTMADYKPQVGIGLQYNAYYAKDILEDVEFQPMLAAQVSIPLFKWGQGVRKREAANYKIQQEETELDNARELIRLEIMQTQIKVQEAFRWIQIAQENISEAKESLEETQASFEVGLNTTSDLLNAQAALKDANTQYVSALAQYRMELTSWERVSGRLSAWE